MGLTNVPIWTRWTRWRGGQGKTFLSGTFKLMTGILLQKKEEDNRQQVPISFNLPDLKMPVAIVTGGNKGIGLGVVSEDLQTDQICSNIRSIFVQYFNVCSIFVQYLFNISMFVGSGEWWSLNWSNLQQHLSPLTGEGAVQAVQGGGLPHRQRRSSWEGEITFCQNYTLGELCCSFECWLLGREASFLQSWYNCTSSKSVLNSEDSPVLLLGWTCLMCCRNHSVCNNIDS